MREQDIRANADFGEQYVIDILRCHDSDVDEEFKRELMRRSSSGQDGQDYQAYPYLVVMPAADKNLQVIIASERVAHDWPRVKLITTHIAEALQVMHMKNTIHGDVKPLNIMHAGDRMKLMIWTTMCF